MNAGLARPVKSTNFGICEVGMSWIKKCEQRRIQTCQFIILQMRTEDGLHTSQAGEMSEVMSEVHP